MENEYYIFTFGCGQKYSGHYVKIYGNYSEARAKMFERFGEDWSFQYSKEEWEDWLKRRPPYIPAETELILED